MWTVGPKVSAIKRAIIHKVLDFGAFKDSSQPPDCVVEVRTTEINA
jgi:hypothetical protein